MHGHESFAKICGTIFSVSEKRVNWCTSSWSAWLLVQTTSWVPLQLQLVQTYERSLTFYVPDQKIGINGRGFFSIC